MKFDTGFDNSKVKCLIIPNIAAVSKWEAAFSYGAEKSGITETVLIFLRKIVIQICGFSFDLYVSFRHISPVFIVR